MTRNELAEVLGKTADELENRGRLESRIMLHWGLMVGSNQDFSHRDMIDMMRDVLSFRSIMPIWAFGALIDAIVTVSRTMASEDYQKWRTRQETTR